MQGSRKVALTCARYVMHSALPSESSPQILSVRSDGTSMSLRPSLPSLTASASIAATAAGSSMFCASRKQKSTPGTPCGEVYSAGMVTALRWEEEGEGAVNRTSGRRAGARMLSAALPSPAEEGARFSKLSRSSGPSMFLSSWAAVGPCFSCCTWSTSRCPCSSAPMLDIEVCVKGEEDSNDDDEGDAPALFFVAVAFALSNSSRSFPRAIERVVRVERMRAAVSSTSSRFRPNCCSSSTPRPNAASVCSATTSAAPASLSLKSCRWDRARVRIGVDGKSSCRRSTA
mmetsp:Transcript_11488/g.19502  ORF Transcript_11488/g.19502 Transcript_11488/m.19502 type:complete len:287 (-) Transcript_11488:324-1184(-)